MNNALYIEACPIPGMLDLEEAITPHQNNKVDLNARDKLASVPLVTLARLKGDIFGAFCLDVRTLTFCHLMGFH